MDRLPESLKPLASIPYVPTLVGLLLLGLGAWLTDLVLRTIVRRFVSSLVRRSSAHWDDVLFEHRVFRRLVHVAPAWIVHQGIGAVPGLSAETVSTVRNVMTALGVLAVAVSLNNLVNALNELYERHATRARERPIKGWLQVVQLLVFIVAGVLMLALLIDRSPLLVLSGFGAMTAVLLLVFKDTILSFVANVQLASQDLLRRGDWIEMPAVGADGDVVDIALHTVKVQNWDKTITTIPTHRLMSESFKNWRGMQESGGRRIKRSLFIDQTSVRFLSDAERDDLRRFALIDGYLDDKRRELEDYNAKLAAAGKDPVNTRRVTNLGTFRAYVTAYLRAQPRIHQDMALLVRQLAPGPTGLPLEIYCFTNTVAWVEYEGIQSDIFDHLLAVLPEFDLRLYQQPGAGDVTSALAPLAGAVRSDAA